MEQMTTAEEESFETAGERFPELDDAARRRARERTASGVRAHAALAQESVILHLMRAYN